MGKPKRPEYGNLVMFVFSENIEKKLQILIPMLEKEFGPIDYVSKVLDFSKYTNFYSKEIGEELHGKFLSFKELIYPTEIVNIKLKTNAIEKRFAINGKRKINIDPGYINQVQFVLASTKFWGNRIYLKSGIYAEVTLMFLNGKFHALDYTYPNYKSREYQEELEKIRKIYIIKRREFLRRTVN
ncbi:MAG TPA: DUF4416 family protein [Thermotogaceae bacterium]|nr:DUF4416 family protein [Thermotogota bacterium]HEW91044.1 DUF4416 family protein [Thermotogaceae bacterium]